MIKRIILILLLLPCLAWGGFTVDGVTDPASVDGVAEPAGIDGVASDYGFTPDWTADWDDVAADDERCATTPCPDTWDGIQGSSATKLSASPGGAGNNTLNHSFDTDGLYGNLDIAFANQTEWTATFTVQFDQTTSVSAASEHIWFIIAKEADETDIQFYYGLITDASGDIYEQRIRCFGDDASYTGHEDVDVISGLTLTNVLTITIYWKEETGADTDDGICSVKIDDGSSSVTSGVSNVNNYGYDGLGYLLFSGADSDWGAGSNDTTASFDNFNMYYGVDAR